MPDLTNSNAGPDLTADSRVCPFCSIWLSRVDAARRHAKRCPKRNGRALVDRKRGRRTKSCDQCSRVKVHCKPHKDGPCERCIPRNLKCSFAQHNADLADEDLPDPSLQEASDQRAGRIPLSFLLNATDDQQDYLTERAIAMEPEGTPLGPSFTTNTDACGSADNLLDYLDPSILLLFDQEICDARVTLNWEPDATGQQRFGDLPPDTSWNATISHRLDLLEDELRQFAGSNQCSPNTFDTNHYRSFFTATNVHKFITTFCRKRHYRYPIIHWPTFDTGKISLALLLVVSLTGAAYSYQEGHDTSMAVEARQFYRIADAYIYQQLESHICVPPMETNILTSIEFCQAALLMYALDTLPTGDMDMQHTAVAKRLPTLISALRKLDFVSVRHEALENWRTFIQREQMIRVVAWTFCADCLATVSCNKPPGFSIPEMRGDLPCSPSMWEADEAPFSEAEVLHTGAVPNRLVDLMSRWLNNDWPTLIERLELPVFHLHVMLCGMLNFPILRSRCDLIQHLRHG